MKLPDVEVNSYNDQLFIEVSFILSFDTVSLVSWI